LFIQLLARNQVAGRHSVEAGPGAPQVGQVVARNQVAGRHSVEAGPGAAQVGQVVARELQIIA